MKKRAVILLVTILIVAAAGAAVCAFISLRRAREIEKKAVQKEEIQYTVRKNDNFDVLEDWSTPGRNDEINRIYDISYRRKVKNDIEKLKSEGSYRRGRMLIIHNPFGTNTLSLYFYFITKEKEKTSYTISVDDENIPDFSKTVNETCRRKHEFTIIGLIPDHKNHIILNFTGEDGNETSVSFDYDMGHRLGEEEIILPQTEPGSTASSSGLKNEKISPDSSTEHGLYAIIGNIRKEVDYTYLYDKNGILRAEIPIRGYCSMRFQFQNGRMYFAISNTRIAVMNRLGQIVKIYRTHSRYRMHHDFIVNPDGRVMALAEIKKNRTAEDSIIAFNNKNGEVNWSLCMTKLLGKYIKRNCVRVPGKKLDWIHLNTIQWMGKDSIALSSRETSSVIRVNHIFKRPRLGWIIGDKRVWKGLSYRRYVLKKIGRFPDSCGQHTVTYVPLAGKPDYVYDMYMFNNNYGKTPTRKNFRWTVIKGINTETRNGKRPSKFYRYRVNERKGTYRLIEKFDVPYSSLVSSAQVYRKKEIVVDSGVDLGMITIYDLKGRIKQRFQMRLDQDRIYRVYKYSFEDFFFDDVSDGPDDRTNITSPQEVIN